METVQINSIGDLITSTAGKILGGAVILGAGYLIYRMVKKGNAQKPPEDLPNGLLRVYRTFPFVKDYRPTRDPVMPLKVAVERIVGKWFHWGEAENINTSTGEVSFIVNKDLYIDANNDYIFHEKQVIATDEQRAFEMLSPLASPNALLLIDVRPYQADPTKTVFYATWMEPKEVLE